MGRLKREESGLLWGLLEKKARRKVARYLSLSEVETLERNLASYKKLSARERIEVEQSLRKEIQFKRSGIPAIVSLALACVGILLWILHESGSRQLSIETRLGLFAPVILGFFAPLTLYLLAPYRLRLLFSWKPDIEGFAAGAISLLILVWLLSLIGLEEYRGLVRFDVLTLAVILTGAISAPLLEELLFRELIPSAIGSAPNATGHLVSVTLFALAHLPSTPAMFFMYWLCGGFLSMLRIQSGSLLLPLVVHIAANVAVLFVRMA